MPTYGSVSRYLPSRGVTQRVWATTFADILTLILSFFIATLAVSPLNPASESTGQRQIATERGHSEGLAPQTPVDRSGGTPLAVDNQTGAGRRPVEVIEFTPTDFVPERNELTEMAHTNLKSLVSSGLYNGLTVRIESCARPGDQAKALEVGQVLRRHVFDTVSGRPTVRLAVTDGHCRSVVGLSEDTVARITIRRTSD